MNIFNLGLIFIFYGIPLLLCIKGVLATVKLVKLKKTFQLFLDRSKRENFSDVRPVFLKIRNDYFITVFSSIAVAIWQLTLIVRQYSGLFINIVLMIFLFASSIAAIFIGMPLINLGDQAEKRYRNLYPPVASVDGYSILKKEGFTLHADNDLFETEAEREKKEKIKENPQSFYKSQEEYEKALEEASEAGLTDLEELQEEQDKNLNLDFFSGADEELLKYVGGGKRRDREENPVISSEEAEANTEKPTLVPCPLCGCLNPKKAKSCDFCGAELDFDNDKENVDNSEEK